MLGFTCIPRSVGLAATRDYRETFPGSVGTFPPSSASPLCVAFLRCFPIPLLPVNKSFLSFFLFFFRLRQPSIEPPHGTGLGWLLK